MTAPANERHGSLLETALYRPAHLRVSHKNRACSNQLNFLWKSGDVGNGINVSYEDKEKG